MRYKVVLWGIGVLYNKMLNTFRYLERENQIEIVGVTASEIPEYKSIDGYPIIAKEKITSLEYDYVIILSDDFFDEIVKSAIENLHVLRDKILSYRILELPYFDFDKYIELKNSRLSIVSNNCWGGMISNTLCLENLSPFKNLYLTDEHYLKLLGNLRYYLSCEPIFDRWEIEVHSGIRYPVGKLGDVEVHYNHDTEWETVITNWSRRIKKFNWDNVMVEMYTSDSTFERKFADLNQFTNKVCFVPWEAETDSSMQLLSFDSKKEFWEIVLESTTVSGKSFDMISLLLNKRKIRVTNY